MSDEWLFFEFMECDTEAHQNRRQKIRQQCDPFKDLSDEQFIKQYRLTKNLAINLCNEIRPLFKVPKKSTDLSVEIKVLTALSFYATGSYQKPTGELNSHGMSQQTVSHVLTEVTNALNTAEMIAKYIHFPRTVDERNIIRKRFMEEFKFPGVLGCIDCTQVAIVRPTEHREQYICQKKYHSLNVQLICDADMQIISVDSSYGGASHKSFIWSVHPLRQHMEYLDELTWFLGDSGYPLRHYMLTPFADAAPGTPEQHYTDIHVQTRNIIEQTIGQLKARFRCLLTHKVLHYKPQKAAFIVNACVILHNICNRAGLPPPTMSAEDILQEAQLQLTESAAISSATPSSSDSVFQQGVSTRNSVVHFLWNEGSTGT